MPDRTVYLGPHDMYRLDQACITIVDAFAGTVPYLVGSVWTRPNFRDVDVRLMLADDDLAVMFAGRPNLRPLINCALSDWLARASGLPIDFQIQTVTEGNEQGAAQCARREVPGGHRCLTCCSPPPPCSPPPACGCGPPPAPSGRRCAVAKPIRDPLPWETRTGCPTCKAKPGSGVSRPGRCTCRRGRPGNWRMSALRRVRTRPATCCGATCGAAEPAR